MQLDEQKEQDNPEEPAQFFYRVQFRPTGQHLTASASAPDLRADSVVMVRLEQGLEPARVVGFAPMRSCRGEQHQTVCRVERLANDEEIEKFGLLAPAEDEAFDTCSRLIGVHKLSMRLVRVEKFFNGSKMIFYFTAENRVDFRALVKDLVQEFRTRVEMRQVGVRHETKMLGGVGTCGRELCCASFISNFDSVSIKMAKEQDLPLNPTKISGVCNRLLCCLTYEYESYKKQRRSMPKPGKRIKVDNQVYQVKRQQVLLEQVLAVNEAGEEVVLTREQWKSAQMVKKEGPDKGRERQDSGKGGTQQTVGKLKEDGS